MKDVKTNTKDITTILEARQGMVQFIGSVITQLNHKPEEARQIVCAILLEEALRLVTVDNTIELFSAKPILRATMRVLDSRLDEYEKLSRENPDMVPMLTQAKIEMLNIRKLLEKLTETKEND